MKNSAEHKLFYILIPISAIVLAFVINIIMDNYYKKKLEKDSLEIVNYIITKDFQTADEYKELALQEYEDRKYTDSPDSLIIRLGHEYMVFFKYHPINDLKTFLNIFKVKWVDKDGYIDDQQINEGMDEKTGVLTVKYIIYLNEYDEPIIEQYTDEKELELIEMEKEKYPDDIIH